MRVLIIQNDPIENLGLYEKYLDEKGIDHEVYHAYLSGKQNRFPDENKFDHFIIGPTPISANKVLENEFLSREWKYLDRIIKNDNPCLGVCCGGQILAKKLGAKVRHCKTREIGIYRVSLTEQGIEDPIFSGFPEDFSVFQWHRDMFEVPPGGKILVKGAPCLIQAFGWRNLRGIIFHLEIDENEATRWAEAYPSELKIIGKNKRSVLNDCKKNEGEMRKLAYLLIENFLKLDEY